MIAVTPTSCHRSMYIRELCTVQLAVPPMQELSLPLVAIDLSMWEQQQNLLLHPDLICPTSSIRDTRHLLAVTLAFICGGLQTASHKVRTSKRASACGWMLVTRVHLDTVMFSFVTIEYWV
uniref:Uncharacterized protein n=1 Tax=Arundo donax TaxID=35708 RepID=A0A0A8YZ92_ARUDO